MSPDFDVKRTTTRRTLHLLPSSPLTLLHQKTRSKQPLLTPPNTFSPPTVSGSKVLFVLSSHPYLLDGKTPTGWYLPEAAHPYYAVTSAGYQVDFASPKGGHAPLDPKSVEAFKEDSSSVKFHSDPSMKKLVENTHKLSEVKEEDYVAIFYVGGHGPCFDVCQDEDSIRIAETLFKSGRPVAAVCHGPVAFHKVKGPDGKSIFSGRKATCFSNEEEEQVGLTKAIPFLVESDIVSQGGKFIKERQAWGVEVVVDDSRDGTLITGANPASATKTGEALVEAIKKMEKK